MSLSGKGETVPMENESEVAGGSGRRTEESPPGETCGNLGGDGARCPAALVVTGPRAPVHPHGTVHQKRGLRVEKVHDTP